MEETHTEMTRMSQGSETRGHSSRAGNSVREEHAYLVNSVDRGGGEGAAEYNKSDGLTIL